MGRWPEISVIAGAAECLAIIHASCRIVIATNATVSKRPMIELALRRGGLLQYIDAIFCFTELGYRKDQAEFWEAVETGMSVPLTEMSMVGDSLEQDVVAPARFGLRAMWFNQDGRQPVPESGINRTVVTRLTEVPRLVLG